MPGLLLGPGRGQAGPGAALQACVRLALHQGVAGPGKGLPHLQAGGAVLTHLLMTEATVEGLVIVLVLVAYVIAAHCIAVLRITFLHESMVAITLGALIAFIAHVFGETISFTSGFFFNVVLPPIIFAAGYNLRRSLFFHHFGVISFMGIGGTLLSFMAISGLLYLASLLLGGLALEDILYLAAVLCAADTVAPLALVRQEEYPVLNSVLFGEGIVNDATAIILFNSIRSSLQGGRGSAFGLTALRIGFDFLYLFLLSIAVGAGLSLGCSPHQSQLLFQTGQPPSQPRQVNRAHGAGQLPVLPGGRTAAPVRHHRPVRLRHPDGPLRAPQPLSSIEDGHGGVLLGHRLPLLGLRLRLPRPVHPVNPGHLRHPPLRADPASPLPAGQAAGCLHPAGLLLGAQKGLPSRQKGVAGMSLFGAHSGRDCICA